MIGCPPNKGRVSPKEMGCPVLGSCMEPSPRPQMSVDIC